MESESELEVSLSELDVPYEMEPEVTWMVDAESWLEGT